MTGFGRFSSIYSKTFPAISKGESLLGWTGIRQLEGAFLISATRVAKQLPVVVRHPCKKACR